MDVSLSLLNLLSPSLNVCPDIFVVAQFLHPSLYVRYFTCENSRSLQSNQILSVLLIFMLVLHTPPVTVPLVNQYQWPEKAIDNHTTTFCCRLRPIRANHCTVGVVLAVSFCLVCGCFSWRVRPAVSLPAYPTPPQPVALLSGVGFKGKETHHWLYTAVNHTVRVSSHFTNLED